MYFTKDNDKRIERIYSSPLAAGSDIRLEMMQ
jgi:hypothetical protein